MSGSEGVFGAIFDASPDGVIVTDQNGTILMVNRACESVFGYEAAELVGKPVEALVPDSLRRQHGEHRERYHLDPHTRPMGLGITLRGRRADGSEVPLEISLSPMEVDGEIQVIASIRDVTEQQRLRSFGARALRASEEERQRIARDLHDDTAQRLATILVRLAVLERAGFEGDWRDQLGGIREELKACAEGVRIIARGLRPPALEDAGVVAAIEAHLRTVSIGSDAELVLDADPIDGKLPDEASLILYRVVQEALSNAVRHSGARRIKIRIRADERLLTAEVLDDGAGFRLDHAESSELGGLGLVGMRERAVMVGGSVVIKSSPGEGTQVRLEIPLRTAEEVSDG